jgi:hypothetical protein
MQQGSLCEAGVGSQCSESDGLPSGCAPGSARDGRSEMATVEGCTRGYHWATLRVQERQWHYS